MKKRYLIMLPGLLMSISAKADISAFDKILVKYCVPKNGMCDTKATYTTASGCGCPSGKLYVDRECLTLKCPAGTYISLNNDTDDCSPGMYRSFYRN